MEKEWKDRAILFDYVLIRYYALTSNEIIIVITERSRIRLRSRSSRSVESMDSRNRFATPCIW